MTDSPPPLTSYVVTERVVDLTTSFERFFGAEQHRLFSALCVVTGDRSEAEEITQDALVRVFGKWDRVSTLDDPTGYLYRTAMNLIRSKHRRSLMMARRQPEPIVSSDPFPGLVVRLDLVTALGQLTRRQRAALVLTDLLGFSSDDVGEMLSLSPSTVRVHAARGRAVLKEALGHG